MHVEISPCLFKRLFETIYCIDLIEYIIYIDILIYLYQDVYQSIYYVKKSTQIDFRKLVIYIESFKSTKTICKY